MTRPRPHLRAVSGADDPDPPVSDADLLRSIALGGEMGLRDVRIMMAIYDSIRRGAPVELAPG